MLQAHEVKTLVDIRAFPMSRRLPQFNRESLQQTLPATGITYLWMKYLGGYRKKILPESPNIALRNDSFRNYADYMQQGKGTAGKFLKDPALYNNANDTISNLKKITDDINAGKGAIGKLSKDEELAKKLDTTITKLSELTTQLEAGQGTAGKLIKDETLYNNTNQTMVETQELLKAIRQNPKKYLSIKLHIF